MSEEQIDGRTTDSATTTEANDADGDNAESTFVGTYKTKEAAEKGLREKDEFINKLKAEVEASRKASKTDEILALLAKNEGKTPEPARDPEKDWAPVLEKWDAGDAKTQLGIIEALLNERIGSRTSQLEKLVQDKVLELTRGLKDVDPTWQKVKDRASELAKELGMDVNNERDRDVLIKIATKLTPDQTRINPPGQLPVSHGGETRKTDPELEREIKQYEKELGVTLDDGQRKELMAQWRAK